jgi:hypothetical protein
MDTIIIDEKYPGLTATKNGWYEIPELDIKCNVEIRVNLRVLGSMTVGGNHYSTKSIIVEGYQHVGGDQHVLGNQYVGRTQRVSGDQRVIGYQHVEWNQFVIRDQYVGGDQYVGKYQHVGRDQYVGGDQRVGGDQYVGGGQHVEGNQHVGRGQYVVGYQRVGGDQYVGVRETGTKEREPMNEDDDLQEIPTETQYRTAMDGIFLEKINLLVRKVRDTRKRLRNLEGDSGKEKR